MSKEMTVTEQLRSLGINESCTFPAERMNSVKTLASQYGFLWGKVFSSTINRKERVVTITRTK